MTTLNDIWTELRPTLLDIESRIKTKEVTDLDRRVLELAKKIKESSNTGVFTNISVNATLSSRLTLIDFKTSLKCGSNFTNMILDYLALKQYFDEVDEKFKVIERIQMVSEEVLGRVTLMYLQFDSVENSLIWYVVAPDEELLKHPVRDLGDGLIKGDIASMRLCHLEKESAHLFEAIRNEPFDANHLLEMSIGKLRTLSGNDLNTIAKELPPSAFILLSDDQIKSLKISRLSSEQIYPLFENKDTDVMAYRVSLVSLEEIGKGLDQIPNKFLKYLTYNQIEALDYSRITDTQLENIFTSYFVDGEKRRQSVQWIPLDSVNSALKVKNDLVLFMLREQCLVINLELLKPEIINCLFPGFTLETLYLGYTYTPEEREGEQYHVYERKSEGGSTTHRHTQKEVDALIVKNKKQCRASLEKFSPEQLEAILGERLSEIQKEEATPGCVVQ